MNFRHRKDPDDMEEMLQRLRLASAECSDAGLEETDAGEVVEAPAARQAPRDYCAECHISFGLAEKRVKVGDGVMHQDCFEKFLRRETEKAERINRFFRRVH